MAVNIVRKSKNEDEEEKRKQLLAQMQENSQARKNAEIQAVKNSNVKFNNPYVGGGTYLAGKYVAGLGEGTTNIVSAPMQTLALGFQQGSKQASKEQTTWDKIKNIGKNTFKTFAYADPTMITRLMYDTTVGRDEFIQNANEVNTQIQQNASQADSTWKKATAYLGGYGSYIQKQYLNSGLNQLQTGAQSVGQVLGSEKSQQASQALLQADDKLHEPIDKLNEELSKSEGAQNKVIRRLGNASYTIGNMTPSILISALSGGAGASDATREALSLTSMGISAKGGSTREGLKQGLDLSTAERIGVSKGMVEVGTEKMWNGLSFLKSPDSKVGSAIRTWIGKQVENRIKSQFGKTVLTKWIPDLIGENLEEFVSGIYDNWLDRATVDPNRGNFFKEQSLDTLIDTTLSTLLMNSRSYVLETKAIHDRNKSGNQTNVNTEESNGYKQNLQEMVNNLDIPNEMKAELQQTIDSNETITGEEYNNTKERIKSLVKQNTQQQIDSLSNNLNNQYIDIGNRLAELDTLKQDGYQEGRESRRIFAQQLNANFDDPAFNTILGAYPENRNGRRTVGQYKEIAKAYGQQMALDGLSVDEVRRNAVSSFIELKPARRENITQYDNRDKTHQSYDRMKDVIWTKTIYDSYKDTMRTQLQQQQEALSTQMNDELARLQDEENILIDTIDNLKPKASPEQVARTKKLIEDFAKARGVNVEYNAEVFKNNNEEGFIKDKGNGERTIYINPNADTDTILVKLATHEMFHDTIRTQPHDKLTQLVMDRLKADENYDMYRQSVVDAYLDELNKLENTNKEALTVDELTDKQNALIDEEMTAKYLGEYLGDEQFVQQLVNSTNRSTIQRIVDWIDNRLQQIKNVVTGNKEAEYWRKVRENFEKAYNSKYQGQEGTQYSKDLNISDDGNARFSEDRLNYIIRGSVNDYSDNYARSYITKITPQQFLDLTTTPEGLQRLEGESTELNPEQLKGEQQNIFLRVDMETGKVLGHEGRHRMIALRNAGVNNVDIEIIPQQGTYDTENAKDFNYGLYLIGQSMNNGQKGKNVDFTNEITAVTKNNLDKIKQEYLNNNDNANDIRYSKKTSFDEALQQDNKGRELSEEQKEYFKDSKVRDRDGNLITLYHGTDSEVTTFDTNKPTYARYGSGAYLTDGIGIASEFADIRAESNNGKARIIEGYANIDKMFDNTTGLTENTPERQKLFELLKERGLSDRQLSNIESAEIDYPFQLMERYLVKDEVTNDPWIKANTVNELLREAGYNGIKGYYGDGSYEYVTFNSNQIKDIENKKPTTNDDIRYSKKTAFDKALQQDNQKTNKPIKENRQYLEKQFEELTGDSILRADAKLAGREVRNKQRQAGNLEGEMEALPYNEEAMNLYKKIKSSVKSSNYLYHSTPADRLQSIIENGLTIGNKQNQEGVSSKDKLYLSASEELANSFTPDDSITFRINPNAKLENLDSDLLGGEGAYTITNNIPAEMLQVKENGKWVRLDKSELAKTNGNQIKTTDNQGRTLTREQQEYFKDSKVRDENGNLLEVYHSTPTYGFNIFDAEKLSRSPRLSQWGKGFYFTDNEMASADYKFSETGWSDNSGTYKTYLNITNPLILNNSIKATHTLDRAKLTQLLLEGNNDYFFDSWIPFEIAQKELNNDETFTKEQLQKMSREEKVEKYLQYNFDKGYTGDQNILKETLRAYKTNTELIDNFSKIFNVDGIIVKGGRANQYIAFNSNQIKNVDNLKPTKNPDIRYSKKTEFDKALQKDNQGKTLSEGQQKYFENSKVRDENGNLLEVYHASKNDFTTFDKNKIRTGITMYANSGDGFYFTDSKGMVDDYGKGEGKIYTTYLNITNPLVVENNISDEANKVLVDFSKKILEEHPEINDRTFMKYEVFDKNNIGQRSGGSILSSVVQEYGNEFTDYLKSLGYDGIKESVTDYNNTGAKYDYIAFEPNQIKNVDNTNPTENPDIRYNKKSKAYDDYLKANNPNRSGVTIGDLKNSINLPTKETKAPTTKKTQTINSTIEEPTLKVPVPKGESGTEQKVAKVLSEPITKVKPEQRAWALFKANILDKGAVFEDLSFKSKNRELQAKWDSTLLADAKGQNAIGQARYEFENGEEKQVSKALTDIIDEVGENSEDFNNYMYHQLNIDRMTLEDRFDIANKPVFGDGIDANYSKQKVAELEKTHPEFKEYAQDVYDYLDTNKKELVDNGVISQETSDRFKEMYPHYVPIARIDAKGQAINVPLDTNRTGVNSPIKRAKGGSQDIQPLFQTIADRTMQTYKASARNSFGLELKNTLDNLGMFNQLETTTENADNENLFEYDGEKGNLTEGTKYQNPTFTVFENGEKVTYEINQDMYDALRPKNEIFSKWDNTKLMKATRKFNDFRRGILTEYNPAFSITNAIKDAQDVLMNSQHAGKTYAKFPEAYSQILKKGYWYKEYVQNGGSQNSYFTDGDFVKKDSKAKSIIKMPLEAISNINNVIEMSPRLAEYIASREQGKSIQSAMLDASRVTTNFKAGGDVTKFLNRNGATFLNASVQGLQQNIRNIREANAKGLKGYGILLGKAVIASLPALILNNLVWRDDDDYEELQDYVKDNYYIIAKIGDHKFLRIPKGRTVAVIQKAVTNMSDFMTNKGEIDPDKYSEVIWGDLKDTFELASNNLAPNNPIENNIVSPIVQAVNNKTWYGEDLVPTRLKDKPDEEKYDESTAEISKQISGVLNKIGIKSNPMQINYLLDQYGGGVSDVFLPMGTPQAENNMIEDKFTTDSVMKSRYPGEFFELKDKLAENRNSSKATDEDELLYKYADNVSGELSDLYKKKREIQNSSLTDKEKKKQIAEVQKQINSKTQQALKDIKEPKVSGDTATIGNSEYIKTLNANSGEYQWNKLTDKTRIQGISLKTQADYQNRLAKYKQKTGDSQLSDKEEAQIILDGNYSSKDKKAIYLATAGKKDTLYKSVSDNLNIDEYLDYKTANIQGVKGSDGKTINGTKKQAQLDYINENISGYENRLLLMGKDYKLSRSQQQDLSAYIDTLDNAEELYTMFDKNFTVKSSSSLGQYGKGNIDLYNRPIVTNSDGSISTVRSMSFEENGKEVLIPTVVNGRVVSDDEAIDHYHRTGEYLGKFNSIKEADDYAEKLHEDQEKMYSSSGRTTGYTVYYK